jgi:hypothetical protein
VWLTYRSRLRVAFTPALWDYLNHHFKLIYTDDYGDALYRRIAEPMAHVHKHRTHAVMI